jgi:hypothetical protein
MALLANNMGLTTTQAYAQAHAQPQTVASSTATIPPAPRTPTPG